MKDWRKRYYRGPQDLARMQAFLLAARPKNWLSDYPSFSDLPQLLAINKIQEATRLWEDRDGNLVAYAFVDAPNNLRFELAARARQDLLESAVVDWGVEWLRRQSAAGGSQDSLDAVCRLEDTAVREMLGRHGFQEQSVRTVIFGRSLGDPIPEPELPPGFRIRPVQGEAEGPALIALHQAAHGTEILQVDDRLAWMRAPEYDESLDLVIEGPGGVLAAYCFCQVSAEENRRSGRLEGWTDPLATHPRFQRKGLGTALLRRGMQKFKDRGLTEARLATSSDNGAMLALARKNGFALEITKIWHSKPLNP